MGATLTTVESATRAARPAPVSGWRRMFADSLVTGGSGTVCHALGAVTSLILRALLSPAQMGVWQGLKLFLSYGNYAGLGVSKGAVRELAAARGSGNLEEANRGLNLAFTFNMLTSSAYALLLIGAAVGLASTASGWSTSWSVGLLAIAGLTVLQRYVTFRVTILRAEQAFLTTARLSVLEATVTLLVAGWATWLWGLGGLYVGTCAVLLASLLFLRLHAPRCFRWTWDAKRIARLVSIGGPILLGGVISSLLRSLDKLMILAYLPDREYQLGCYGLALMVAAQLYGVANMFSTVMGPRYCELMGRSGDSRQVARLAARFSHLLAAVVGLASAMAVLIAVPLLAWLLPEYRSGLAPLVWIIPGTIALAIALPASQFLVAVDRQKRIVAVAAVATIIAAVGNHWALTHDGGLIGLALATMIAYLCYSCLLVAVSIWPELTGAERVRYLGGLVLAVGLTTALAMGLESWMPWPGTGARGMGLKWACSATGWIVLLVVGIRLGGWSELWRKER